MVTASRILGDQVGSTAPAFLAILAVHVTAGLTAVITGATAALACKGSSRHVRAGRWCRRTPPLGARSVVVLAGKSTDMAGLDRWGCWSRRRAWALPSCHLPEVWRRWLAATWLFCDAHLEQLRSFPDTNRDQLIRFFTLTPAEVAFIDPGRGRGPADRLGLAAQLCTFPWLGFVPDDRTGTLNGHHAPEAAALANIGYARCSALARDLTAQRQALAALGVPGDRGYLTRA